MAEAAIVLALAGCVLTVAPPSPQQTTVDVVVTSSILADWAHQVGGERVEVFSLTPMGADPHAFQPGARDITRLDGADLVFTMGLGLEADGLDKVVRIAAVGSDRLVALGDSVDPIKISKPEGGQKMDEKVLFDPHFWTDPLRVKQAVAKMAELLSIADPAGKGTYLANAHAYQAELEALHAWIEGRIVELPPERRVLVTSHDNLSYFARRYGFHIVGTVIPGVTTKHEPSAQDLTRLVHAIVEYRVPVVFTETMVSDSLSEVVAKESNIVTVTGLHMDSLRKLETGNDTYIGMMRRNVEIIAGALD